MCLPALAQERGRRHGADVRRLDRRLRPGAAAVLPDLDPLRAVLRDAAAGRHRDRRDRRRRQEGRAPARRRSRHRDLYDLCGPGLAALLARAQSDPAQCELRPDRHRHQGPRGARARQGAARPGARRRRAARGARPRRPLRVRPAGRLPGAVPRGRTRSDEGARDRRAGPPGDGGQPQDHRPASRLERAGEVDPPRGRPGSRPRARSHAAGRLADPADAGLRADRHAIPRRHRAHRRGGARRPVRAARARPAAGA